MLCLGIETSCDETGLALVEDGRLVHSVLASQADIHSLFGGVVPELASREHYRYIGPLFDELLKQSGVDCQKIDYVCAARGPGLLGSLLVGVAFAKALALGLNKPFLGINHLHAHILVTGLCDKLEWPFLGLLTSGGHTCLYRVEAPGKFVILGNCLDDAAGEAFDKIGKFLGMPYPAGKLIDEFARAGDASNIEFPRPYLDNDNLDFSFSGLKTAAAQYVDKEYGEGIWFARAQKNPAERKKLGDFCAAFNEAVAETLCIKTKRAIKRNRDVRALVVAGGVAANSMLRAKMATLGEKYGLALQCPKPALCTDNGIMIAQAGYLLAREGFCHGLEMETIPRGRRMPDDMKAPQNISA